MDLVSDQLFDGRRSRALDLVDNYSRECLEIEVGQNLKGNVWQYLRKAEGFARNLRGATVIELEDGAKRYVKKGYYLIKDRAGKIVSYGRESQ